MNSLILKRVLILIICLSAWLNINAQSINYSQSDSSKFTNALEINFLNEQSISFRYRFNNSLYWKIGADLSSSFATDYKSDTHTNGVTFGIRINNQLYITIFSVDFFNIDFGIGPLISYKSNYKKTNVNADNYVSDYHEYTFEYGVINSLVTEIKLSKKLFLIFKYDYTISKSIFNSNKNSSYKSEQKTDNNHIDFFNLTLSKLKIGIGINF